MTIRSLERGAAMIVAIWLAPVCSVSTAAQAPAPAAASLVGTWSLDPYVSDHPEQVARALRFDTREPAAAGRGQAEGEHREGRGEPEGVERTARTAGERSGSPRQPISGADRKRLTELTDAVRFPPLTLTIARTDAGVTLATGVGGSDVLHPDGKAEERTLTSGTVTRTATWDQAHLVVAYAVGDAGTLTYTYAVAPTTGQLVVRVDFERPQAESPDFEITLVYDPAAA